MEEGRPHQPELRLVHENKSALTLLRGKLKNRQDVKVYYFNLVIKKTIVVGREERQLNQMDL